MFPTNHPVASRLPRAFSARLNILSIPRRTRFAVSISVIFTVIGWFALATLAVKERARFGSASDVAPAAVDQSPRVNAIRFRISPRGIEPAELTIPPGRYWVAVDNDNDLNETTINIDKVNDRRVKSGKNFKGQRKFRDYVDFTPGQYVLSEISNPKRVSRITATNTK